MIEKLRSLKNNAGFVRYFKNTSWVFGEKILRIFAALVVGVWVTRYLGPENLGILSYAQSFVTVLLAFSTLGINGILVRELVITPDKTHLLLGTSFAIQTGGSIILMVFLLVGISFSDNDPFTNKIIVLLGSVTFLQSFNVISSYFQGIVKSRVVVIVSLVGLVISSIVKIILILLEAPLIAFVYVLISDSLLLALGLIYFYNKEILVNKKWGYSKKLAIALLKDSWPLILSGIMVSIYMKVDQIMIKEIMDNQSVGQYSAAVRLSEAWYFIPSVIAGSLFPAIVNAKKHSQELFYSRLQRLYDFMVYLALSIAIPMTFLSDWLVDLLYGEEFYQAGAVLSIHIWTGVFVFLGVSREGWVLNENLQRYTSLYLGIGTISNVVLNFFLIKSHGIIGAAYASLISQSISVLWAPLFFKPTRISFHMMIKSLSFYSLFKKLGTKK